MSRDIKDFLVKNLWSGCFKDQIFMRYDIIVNYLAIENFYGKNDVGWDMWLKYQKDAKPDVLMAKNGFLELIKSFERDGNRSKEFPLMLAEAGHLHIREGAHRMACALYFDCEKLYGFLRNPHHLRRLQKYAGRNSYGAEAVFVNRGFSPEEIKILINKKDEINEKIKRDLSRSDKVLKLIDYTKLNKNSYTGRNFKSGYHSFVLEGVSYEGTRNNLNRIDRIKDYDFTNKVILDLGCNMGGMLHALSSKIKYGVGVDFDKKCINVANMVKDVNKISNLHFYIFDLDKEDLDLVKNFVLENRVDICFFLAVAQHIKKWKEVVQLCYGLSEYLLFESNGKQWFRDAQIDFIKRLYQSVVFLGNEGRRSMFLCRK